MTINRVKKQASLAVISLVLPTALAQFPASWKATQLDGANGFIARGVASNQFARTLAGIGDVNGDGVPDLASGGGGLYWWEDCYCEPTDGMVWVVFGRSDVAGTAPWLVTDLLPGQGFHIPEVGFESSFGNVQGAGDFNHDGIADFTVGASGEDGEGWWLAGQAYVIYGSPDLGASGQLHVSKLGGANGFVLFGSSPLALVGARMAPAGDFNADGVDDIMFGIPRTSPQGLSDAGRVYVVFGGTEFGVSGSASIAQVGPESGIFINGTMPNERVGQAVWPAGDVNGDGCADILIGTGTDQPLMRTYVVFGGLDVAPDAVIELSALDGTNGFRIEHPAAPFVGSVVAGIGDVNADGFDDVATVVNNSWIGVVFGGPNVAPGGFFDLTTLDGENGFKIVEDQVLYVEATNPAPAGDLNHDGIADFSVQAGFTYVLFGSSDIGASGKIDVKQYVNGRNGFEFKSANRVWAGVGDVNVDGLDDLAIGATYDFDAWTKADLGELEVIFGRRLGDGNCDGRLDAFDIDPFILAAIDPDGYAATYPDCIMNATDINGDGKVDAFDIDPFVKLLTGP